MKLLVACPRRLLRVDAESGQCQLVESDRPEYYGISWPENGRVLCLGHSGIENAKLGTLQSYMKSEVGWISFAGMRGPESLSMAHQILCADDRVIVTNTGRNCLTVFRTEDWFYRHYWFDDIRWDRNGTDDPCGSHFNSIFLHHDQLYVVAHNFDRGSNILRLDWPDMSVVQVVKTRALMAHNIWVADNGSTIVCDSMRGQLVDARNNDVLWACDVPNVVTRGLAATDKYVFIGHSPIGTRDDRVDCEGRIWIVDRQSWKTIDSLCLPGSGNIHEIRILDEPDSCHHGSPYRGELSMRSEEVPDQEAFDQDAPAACPGLRMRPPMIDSAEPDRVDFVRLNRWVQHFDFGNLTDDRAETESFSLATVDRFVVRNVRIQADVELRSAKDGHVGIVARYGGPADSNMVAALIARSEKSYSIQLWCHDSGAWSCVESARIVVGFGQLELVAVGEQYRVLFDGRTLIKVNISGSIRCGSVGIRASGGVISMFQAENLDRASYAIPLRRAA